MTEISNASLEAYVELPHHVRRVHVMAMARELLAARARIAELEQQTGRRIETVEELDALPILTIIREQLRATDGIDYGGVWERRVSGWECIAGGIGWLAPKLPVTVLWQPEVSS